MLHTSRNALNLPESTDIDFPGAMEANSEIIDAAIAKCTDAKASDPTANDDEGDGYSTRSICITVGHKIFLCENPIIGAAVWRQIWPPLVADLSGTINAATLENHAASYFAEASKGVTNGDSHDHNGGDGGTISYNNLSDKPSLAKTTWINFIIGGSTDPIATGIIKGDITLPACTLKAVRLTADQTGSIQLDIWKDTFANFPPTVADTIVAAAPPTISSGIKYEDTTLTGWTTSFTDGVTLRVSVTSNSVITCCTLSLKIEIP